MTRGARNIMIGPAVDLDLCKTIQPGYKNTLLLWMCYEFVLHGLSLKVV